MTKCILCGRPIRGKYGNNPWPLKEEGQCCDSCNTTKVIPARLELMFKNDASREAKI